MKALQKVLMLLCVFLCAIPAFGQVKVTGVVRGADKETLIGVSVRVVNQKEPVTATDNNGEFTLSVSQPDAKLIFSYVGYKTLTVALKGRTALEVTMEEDATKLSDVVVVGYATQNKQTLTGSVASVSSKELSVSPIGNITSMLSGRLPGLTAKQTSGQPGLDGSQIRIRGLSTTGNSSPTVIVDGVQRSFDNYDPNEIASISILKDASAAAVYGVQGAGGVILVTTKRGVLNSKPVLQYNAGFSYNQNTAYPKFLSGPDFVKYYNKALALDGKQPLFSDEVYQKLVNGDPTGKLASTDWFEQVLKPRAYSTHHDISVSGGSNTVRYFLLLGYLAQDGIIEKIDFQRYNLRSNVDVKLDNGLSVGIDLGARSQNRRGGYFSIANQAYNNPLTLAARTLPIIPPTYQGLPTAASLTNEAINPVAYNELTGYNNSQNNVLESKLTAEWALPMIKGLNLKFVLGYDRSFYTAQSWCEPFDVNFYNIYTGNYTKEKAIVSYPNTQVYRKDASQSKRITLQPTITYQNSFGLHDINALFVYEQSAYDSDNLFAAVQDFDLSFLHELDLAKSLFGGKDAKVKGALGGSSYVFHRAGYVGRLNYAYAKKYLAEFVFRYDGSTRFPRNKRWGFFPAVSLGWRISEENFFKENIHFIDNLKFRASAGLLGNDRIGDFSYLNLMMPNPPTVYFGNQPYISVYTSGLANPNITWEKTATYNIGFDLMSKNALFAMEFDYFYKLTSDILMGSSNYPPSLGANYPGTINGGMVQNHGLELSLSHNNHFGEVYYSVRANLGWSRNKVLRMTESVNVPDYQKRTGRPMGEKLGFIADGLYQHESEIWNSPTLDHLSKNLLRPGDIKYRDINGDGRITRDQDYTVIGRSSFPELMYGLNFDVNWCKLNFSLFFQGAAIMDIGLNGVYGSGHVDGTQFTRPFYGSANSPYFLIENAWTPEKPNAEFTRLTTLLNGNPNGWASSWWIRDASYLRLKNVQLSYDFGAIRMMGLSAFKISLKASNLFTWSKLSKYNIDPEAPEVTNGYYPQQRSYEMSFNLSF